MYNIAIDYSHQARSVTDARTTPAILALPVRDLSHVDHKLRNSKKVGWSEGGRAVSRGYAQSRRRRVGRVGGIKNLTAVASESLVQITAVSSK